MTSALLPWGQRGVAAVLWVCAVCAVGHVPRRLRLRPSATLCAVCCVLGDGTLSLSLWPVGVISISSSGHCFCQRLPFLGAGGASCPSALRSAFVVCGVSCTAILRVYIILI